MLQNISNPNKIDKKEDKQDVPKEEFDDKTKEREVLTKKQKDLYENGEIVDPNHYENNYMVLSFSGII